MKRFGILTLSYNKPGYVGDAINSVLAQTFGDFIYAVVDNSTTEKTKTMEVIKSFNDSRITLFEEAFSDDERKRLPVHVVLHDKYFRELKQQAELILWLADDDILYPNCLEEIDRFFKENADVKACYHGLRLTRMVDGKRTKMGPVGWGESLNPACVFGAKRSPDGAIDGGQFCFHSSCLDSLSYPYTNCSKADEFHADGIFMYKVTRHFPAKPLGKILSEKRATTVSCFGSRI